MYCPKCGNKLVDNAKFCNKCGASVSSAVENMVEQNASDSVTEKEMSVHKAESSIAPSSKEDDASVKSERKSNGVLPAIIVAVCCLMAGVACAFIIFRMGILGGASATTDSDAVEDATENETDVVDDIKAYGSSGGNDEAEENRNEARDIDESILLFDDEDGFDDVGEEDDEDEADGTDEMVDDDAIHSYSLVVDNVTWTEAFEECKIMGGYLARINTDEEYQEIIDFIGDDFKGVVYIGARRGPDSLDYHWIREDGEAFPTVINSSDFDQYWLYGEPSYEDVNDKYSVDEEYVFMLYVERAGGWVWNDIPNDVYSLNPKYYDRKIAFICEYE